MIAAISPTIAPPVATRAPVARAGARPRRVASAANGTAAIAAPTVDEVAAIPDHASDPETSVISRAPADIVAPMPSPASTCHR